MLKTEPTPCSTQRTYRIGGISVDFPYKAYASQLAFMGKVITTLERSHRDLLTNRDNKGRNRENNECSRCHALLESPTGTGKSLSLLCSTLAWVKHFKISKENGSLLPPHEASSLPPEKEGDSEALVTTMSNGSIVDRPNAMLGDSDGLIDGGGFMPEGFHTGGGFLPENVTATGENTARGNKQSLKKRKTPTIFYATRTHSQITQVLGEFRKTNYRVPMAVLAARKHYCTNKHVCKKKNVDEECKLLLKDAEKSCPQFKNFHKVKNHSSLQKGGSHEIHDIEDLVTIGKSVRGCAYFASRSMASDAEIVFCPYVYLLNPVIRSAMEIDIDDAIVILDEAHNIEDVAREAGSIDLETSVLEGLRTELEQLSSSGNGADIYHPLLEMVQEMVSWIYDKSNSLKKQDFERYSSCWFGENALQELELAGVPSQSFQMLSDCVKKAVGVAADAEPDSIHLSGFSAGILEGLFSVLNYMLKDNGRNLPDYRVVLQKYIKRDQELGVSGWVSSLSFWCLNPAVVFEEVASKARSIILTSGTLSPIGSFASELGIPFEVCMEAPHVIDMKSQVFAASIAKGPGNVSLNASYKHADGYAFQDDLGTALEEIFKVSPDGALVFFPSYKLLDKLCDRWKSTGQWTRLSRVKHLFIEPRGKLETFEVILQDYYQTINGKLKNATSKRNSRIDVKKNAKELKTEAFCSMRGQPNNGAAFLAVCRGKVSEGIDFSDKYARVVIVVGIPFPNQKDLQVNMKKQYNTQNRLSKNLLNGDQWYCYQAFRALNQAVGRCIRHRHDYGAIILLDERYKRSGHLDYISKWLRGTIHQVESFAWSLEGIGSFFQSFKIVDNLQVPPIKGVEINKMEGNKHLNNMQENENLPSSIKGSECLEKEKYLASLGQHDQLPSEDLSPETITNSKIELTRSDLMLDILPLEDIPPQIKTKSKIEPVVSDSTLDMEDISPQIKTNSKLDHVVSDSTTEYPTPASSIFSLKSSCFGGDEALSIGRSSEHSQIQLTPLTFTSTISGVISHSSESAKALYQKCEQPNLPMVPYTLQASNDLISGIKKCHYNAIDKHVVKDGDPLVRSLSSDFSACAEINKSTCDSTMRNVPVETKSPYPLEISLTHQHFLSTQLDEESSSTLCSRCGQSLLKVRNNCDEPKVSLRKKFLTGLLDDSRSGPSDLTDLLVYDISMLDTSVVLNSIDTSHPDKFSQGVWIEEDGCVYKPLFCPSCKFGHCIGGHVLAANRMNMDLVDKVLLFNGSLTASKEGSRRSMQHSASVANIGACEETWFDSHSKFIPKRENQTPRWSKLKLRRGD